MEPMLIAILIIYAMLSWCIYKVWQMKKSFEERGGSYAPLIPEWLKEIK